MRINALGAKSEAALANVREECRASGSATVRARPPLSAAPVLRNVRRPNASDGRRAPVSDMVALHAVCCMMDRRANALIGPATTYVSGHGGIDVYVRGLRGVGEQRRRRHDLPGLTISTLHHVKLHPGSLKRPTLWCPTDG